MGNRLMWANRAVPNVPTLSKIHCIYILVSIYIYIIILSLPYFGMALCYNETSLFLFDIQELVT